MRVAATRLARSFATALRDFLRGFVGATQIGRDAHSVQCALARRAETRRGCC
jgi:hypothetical protein